MRRPREWLRIHDMLDAIDIAEKILAGHGPDPALDDVATLALQRAIEIISEASRHIPEGTKARHATTPWRRIADIGNTLRHAYWNVDQERVLRIVDVDLPALRTVLQTILKEIDDAAANTR